MTDPRKEAEAPKPCPYCGCSNKDSALEKAKKLHSAAMHAALVALSTPTSDKSSFEEFRAAFERAPNATQNSKRKKP